MLPQLDPSREDWLHLGDEDVWGEDSFQGHHL